MLPMLRKHTVITAALLASMSLTACGKKTDVFAKEETVVTVETENKKGQGTRQGPKQQGKGSDTKGSLGGGLPNPNGDDSDNYPPSPEPQPIPQAPKGQTKVPPPPQKPEPLPQPSTPEPTRPTPPPVVVDTQPAPRNPNRLPGDYNSKDAKNVTRDDLSKRFTGGVAEDGLLYTSSSTDELLNFLRLRNERVGYESREANLKAAASVVSAQLVVDRMSDDAIVTLKIKEGADVKVYKVAGSFGGGAASPLRKIKGGTTGTRSLDGTIKCLDLDGGCETTFARLKIGDTGTSAIINVVFRNSISDVYFQLPGEYSNSGEYTRLREFIRNSILDVQTQTRLKEARMSSFEVVNGRSGVTLSLKGLNKELLAFAGPLLAPEAGTGVNINLSRVAQDEEDSLDLLARENSKLTYANWIGQARLVANNGLGQVRVALKMRKRGNYVPEQFAITFMRKINPIVDLTDDNLK
ncbi:hypothetical protein D3C87_89000 [compost metagenome]